MHKSSDFSTHSSGTTAVVLGGSTDIYDARRLLRCHGNAPADTRYEILHGKLHSELEGPIQPGMRTVLLAMRG